MGMVCLALLAVASGCGAPVEENAEVVAEDATPPTLVGAQVCQGCHAVEYAQWQNSHHALAMQPADESTVLAQFPQEIDGLSLSRQGDGFFVTDQAAVDDQGRAQTFAITHTFGVEPLQQYLADTGQGQLQTLRASWDSRPGEAGGQRWFLQYPDEVIPPGDVLHWMGYAQNWNSMCADCHTVGFKKNYDPASQRYDSSFAEMGVSCEACHGPGSDHVSDPLQPLPAQNLLSSPATQPEVCAPCHARRAQIAEGYTAGAPLLDYYVPQLLNPPLYHADGQIDDEVYVYGSFVSSRMHQQGVTCSDCHQPHSAELKVAGDGLCLQCHGPGGNPRFASLKQGVDYTSSAHHLHEPDSDAARCVTCHMPTKTYMGVDVRHDHSLRVPQLKLALDYGVPSPCAACHAEPPVKTPPVTDHFANQLVLNAVGHEAELTSLAADPQQNAIVRATALSRISAPRQAGAVRVLAESASAKEGLLRHAAVAGLPHLPAARRVATFKRLLSDPLRAVRIRAAAVALSELSAEEHARLAPELNAAVQEYIAANELNAEQPAANVNLAMIALQTGNPAEAETYLQRALSLNGEFVPALLNYADLLRAAGRDAEAEPYLATAVNLDVPNPTADYAYAMWLVRNGSRELALIYLRRAYETEPQTPQWAYTYSVALHSLGFSEGALTLLRGLTGQAVYQEELMFLHASIARDLGLTEEARNILTELLRRAPNNANYRALAESLGNE